MTLSVADVLYRAADLIEPEGAWTQRWSARTKRGFITDSLNPEAVCWCAVGAIIAAAGRDDDKTAEAVSMTKLRTVAALTRWNDRPTRKQAEVVSVLREAAALAKASPSVGGGK